MVCRGARTTRQRDRARARREEVSKRKSQFDSVCEIASDPGLIGQALRQIPASVRREADEKGEPWKWLLSFPELSEGYRLLFIAAQSQRAAIRRITEIATGRGSIENSWGQKLVEAMKARDTKAMRHAQGKVFASMWRYNRAESFLENYKDSPSTQSIIRKLGDDLYEKACRKLGRTKADVRAKPAFFEPATITEKIAWELVLGWLRFSNGFPGFCFFSDDALTVVIGDLLKFPDLPLDTLRKTRQSIGLRKASTFISEARKNENGSWEFFDRKGKRLKPASRDTIASTKTPPR